MANKKCFTLAEVLIVIGVVGVVAAISMPTLIKNINEKVKKNQIQVIQSRLIKGLNLYNIQENGLSGKTHENTYEFLSGLSKYFKTIEICENDNLRNCMPYSEFNYERGDGSNAKMQIASLTLADKFKLDPDKYYSSAGIITASGIPYILMLKKNCLEEPDKEMENLSSCIDGIYDYNGSRGPNKFGEDILPLNDAIIGDCYHKIGDTCMTTIPKLGTGQDANKAQNFCQSIFENGYFIDDGYFTGENGKKVSISGNIVGCFIYDYWLAAKIRCETQGYKLASAQDLANLASEIYGVKIGPKEGKYATRSDIYKKYFTIPEGYHAKWPIWADQASQTGAACYRSFSAPNYTGYDCDGGKYINFMYFCTYK